MFDPENRLTACAALADPFFDELKAPGTVLMPNGKPLPNLFNFTHHGQFWLEWLRLSSGREKADEFVPTSLPLAELSIRPDLVRHIIPPHREQQIYDETGVDLNDFTPVDLASLRVDID
jgi:hypothetical protein